MMTLFAFIDLSISWWVAAGGGVLVSVPIIIHLLNRRRFKTVEWAAMDLLLEADVKNRRRVRIENLLLLLLRCLAVLLIGLVLAAVALNLTGISSTSAQFERIVLLDDSLSMQARDGNATAMSRAKAAIATLMTEFSNSDSDDRLTLLLTSDPSRRHVNREKVDAESIISLKRDLGSPEKLPVSDKTADLAEALLEVERSLAEDADGASRVVYIVSDMRRRDWARPPGADKNHPLDILRRISESEKAAACFVIDAGSEDHGGNIAVTAVRAEDILAREVESHFIVDVENQGPETARDLEVTFRAGNSLEVKHTIDRLDSGASESIPFTWVFGSRDDSPDRFESDEDRVLAEHSVRVQVDVAAPAEADVLPPDSRRFYAARIVPGVPTLVIDGDPSAVYYRAESFFLKRALTPPGKAVSGVALRVATESEIDSLSFDDYRVIFLCNIAQLNPAHVRSLETWVARGGGLVIMPGDIVEEQAFNEDLFKNGDGLSPIRLEGVRGGEDARNWVGFQFETKNHPVLSGFDGQNNPLLGDAKVFKWWASSLPKPPAAETEGTEETAKGAAAASPVMVTARLTDPYDSPAMVEKSFGKGRVLAMTIPADTDPSSSAHSGWSNWPNQPSYVVAMLLIVKYMAGKLTAESDLRVGEPLRDAVDLRRFDQQADVYYLKDAADKEGVRKAHLRADEPLPSDSASAAVANETRYLLAYNDTAARGFYRIDLKTKDDIDQHRLFAANIDPVEGDLRPADLDGLNRDLAGSGVQLINAEAVGSTSAVASTFDIPLWWYFLAALIGVLCTEQALAWLFGRRR